MVALLITMTLLAIAVSVALLAAYVVAVAWLGRATYRFALAELNAADARRLQSTGWTAGR